MNPYIILVAGIPASGKTTYAKHIAEKLHIPFIGKDAIKEKMYDIIHFDTSKRENSQLYGMASYSVFFHITECLMKADVSFVIESNFPPYAADVLLPLIETYSYQALTVLFDADIEVLHKRFLKRDVTDERHPGLTSKSNVFDNFNIFSKETLPLRNFCVGDRIIVDTTDFTTVDYNEIDARIFAFVEA